MAEPKDPHRERIEELGRMNTIYSERPWHDWKPGTPPSTTILPTTIRAPWMTNIRTNRIATRPASATGEAETRSKGVARANATAAATRRLAGSVFALKGSPTPKHPQSIPAPRKYDTTITEKNSARMAAATIDR